MPIHPDERSRYPADWKAISLAIRVGRAKGRCEWCGVVNGQPHPVTGSKVVLTVAHLDHCPEHNEPQNLAALCQRCHNGYDAAKRHSNRKRRQEKRRGQRRLWGEE